MKNVIIFHGTDCSPNDEYYWYTWLEDELKKNGYDVDVPHYPEINHEDIATFLPKVLEHHEFNKETILVGHSAGAPLILSILERLNTRVKLSLLVAGYSMRLEGETNDPVLQSSYDWLKIKESSKDFVFINSVDDPWGCDDKQGRIMFDKLGGIQIVKNEGHFGSRSQNLPLYRISTPQRYYPGGKMKSLRILIFGDSIGQGFYDELNGGWVQRLQRHYFTEELAGKNGVNVINLSVSGHTSEEVLSRIEFETKARSKDDTDLFTILAIGVNDSYEKVGVRRVNEVDFADNVSKIINIAKSFGGVVVLGCTACVDERLKPAAWDATLHYDNQRLKEYEDILKECAAQASATFVPLWQLINNVQGEREILPDGLHPNAEGHEVIYTAVKEALAGIV